MKDRLTISKVLLAAIAVTYEIDSSGLTITKRIGNKKVGLGIETLYMSRNSWQK